MKDLNQIDTIAVNIIDDLRTVKERMTEEEFFSRGYEDMFFTTILSNREEVEIIPGGKNIKVNYSNLNEFLERTLEVRLNECKKQIKAIKKGVKETFDDKFLRMFSW
jgi:hypothetical protein